MKALFFGALLSATSCLILPAIFLEIAAASELVYQFKGTLRGAKNCEPPSDAFCGPYRGILKIDQDQSGYETAGYSYDYTGDMVVTFADGQTASCRARPPTISETRADHMRTRTLYCLISVRMAPERMEIQLSIDPLENEISSLALVYLYKARTFDIRNLSQVLENLLQPADEAHLFVVGKACSWGPCVDNSVTQLAVAKNASELELVE